MYFFLAIPSLGRSIKKLAWPMLKWYAEGDIAKVFSKGFPLVVFGFDEVPFHKELVQELKEAATSMRGQVATIFVPNDQLEVLKEFNLPPREAGFPAFTHTGTPTFHPAQRCFQRQTLLVTYHFFSRHLGIRYPQ